MRARFVGKVLKLLSQDFWQKGISFNLDSVGFTYKVYWWLDQRKLNEGLEITSKGKEGTNGRQASFLVAIWHMIRVLFVVSNMKKHLQEKCLPIFKKSANYQMQASFTR